MQAHTPRYGHAMTIDPDSPVPVYLQLADILRQQIAAGTIRHVLPSRKALVETYGVAPGTADKAAAVLRAEGLVITVTGKGHYVKR